MMSLLLQVHDELYGTEVSAEDFIAAILSEPLPDVKVIASTI